MSTALRRRVELVLAILSLAILALIVLASSLDAQVIRVPPVRTVATLGACADGSPKLVYVTDGASASDCTTGGGSTEVLCGCQDGSWTAAAAGGAGTVTSAALSVPSIFSLSGSPITTSGTFTLGLANQAANRVWAGPSTGADAAPTFRALVAADIPSPLTASTSGNAATATALAANGANCSAGSAPLGVDASGAAEGCTDYAEAGAVTASGLTVAADRLLGRDTAGTGAIEELSLGSGLTLSGGVLSASGGIGGSTGGADNAVLCSDGTGGATVQACNAASTLGGPLQVGAGSSSVAGIGIGDVDTGLYSATPGQLEVISNGSILAYIGYGAQSRWDFTATLFRIAGSGAISQDPQASPPSSPTLGMTYTDSSSAYCWYDGAAWQVVKGAGTCD